MYYCNQNVRLVEKFDVLSEVRNRAVLIVDYSVLVVYGNVHNGR